MDKVMRSRPVHVVNISFVHICQDFRPTNVLTIMKAVIAFGNY